MESLRRWCWATCWFCAWQLACCGTNLHAEEFSALAAVAEQPSEPDGDWLWIAGPAEAAPSVYPPGGFFEGLLSGVRRVAFWQEDQPLVEQPADIPSAVQPPETTSPGPSLESMANNEPRLSSLSALLDSYTQVNNTQANTAAMEVAGPNANTSSTTDLAELVNRSDTVQTLKTQQRSQVAYDPYIRGFHGGQVYTQADGAYWFPVRADLDTVLSKLDPSTVEQVAVFSGPYGLRFGPGLTFIDVQRSLTPRYPGPYVGGSSGLNYLANGQQFYARQGAFGGSDDWGFRFNYGHRLGNDYRSGANVEIPSSYNVRNLSGDLGFNLAQDSRIEFSYLRQDQTNTEFPLQFYDLRNLETGAYNVRLIDRSPLHPWTLLEMTGWYNRTRFDGNTDAGAKQRDVVSRVNSALSNNATVIGQGVTGGVRFASNTQGDNQSTGARGAVLFGQQGGQQLRLGSDIRYLSQQISENSWSIANVPGQQAGLETLGLGQFTTNLPRARLVDPGVYAEWTLPFDPDWTTTLGARGDWLLTTAESSDLRANTALPGAPDSFLQHDQLWAFYATNELALTEQWTGLLSFGQSQRPPTLLERYADSLFLGIVQSGFTRTIGDPHLDKERNWQIDLGLRADYGSLRFGVSAFHSWVLDYVTLRDNIVSDPAGARLLRYVNTDLATLTGISFNLEQDLNEYLTSFANLNYIDGRDRIIDQPLPQISPLDSRLGVRFHAPGPDRPWNIEFGGRIVAAQNRLGTIRQGTAGGVTLLEQRTPGFAVWHLRANYDVSPTFHVVAGIENLFDKQYVEHLNLRLPAQGAIPAASVFALGFSPFVGIEATY